MRSDYVYNHVCKTNVFEMLKCIKATLQCMNCLAANSLLLIDDTLNILLKRRRIFPKIVKTSTGMGNSRTAHDRCE